MKKHYSKKKVVMSIVVKEIQQIILKCSEVSTKAPEAEQSVELEMQK